MALSFKKKCLNIQDLSYLDKMLSNSMSIKDAFSLIIGKDNKLIIEQILDKLDTGLMIENIIDEYLPKQIVDYVIPLMKSMEFSKALNISLSFYNKQKENENNISSTIAYPLILLFVSLSALYLFDIFGLDTIFRLLKSFVSQIDLIEDIRIVFRIVIYIFYTSTIIILILIAYYSQKKKITYFYLFISKYFPNSLVHTYFCEQFISLLLICTKQGYKTKESITILRGMHNKPIISFLAFHLDEMMLQGTSYNEAYKQTYYDSSLSRFIRIALITNDFERTLSKYLLFAKEKIERKIAKYTLTIQISTYVMIGFIIIFIYQVLFLPMQAISSF